MLGYPRTVGAFLNIPEMHGWHWGLLASRTTGSKPNLGGAQIRFADRKSVLAGNSDERVKTISFNSEDSGLGTST